VSDRFLDRLNKQSWDAEPSNDDAFDVQRRAELAADRRDRLRRFIDNAPRENTAWDEERREQEYRGK
jgi:hypothetical protein